jgi:hypothetical protein
VGNGLADVGFLAVLTIIVLPCCLFTLLALLDRFERNLDPEVPAPPALVRPEPVVATAELDDQAAGGDVVSLPLPVIAVTTAEAPAAATG